MMVAVIGGAGYVGSVLVPLLLGKGHEVTVLDTFMFGPDALFPLMGHHKLTVSGGDVRDDEAVGRAVADADAVINLAAVVGHPACSRRPAEAITTNVDGARCVASHVKPWQLLVQASTGSVYGNIGSECREDTPIRPLTVYGQTKAEAERIALDVGGVALRFATLFGASPRMRLDLLVNHFTYQAVRHGVLELFEPDARRSFLHVRDAARALAFAVESHSVMAGQVFNVGDERLNYSKMQVAERIAGEVPLTINIRTNETDPDERDYVVRYTRIGRLGFRAKTSLEDGIREIVKVARIVDDDDRFRN